MTTTTKPEFKAPSQVLETASHLLPLIIDPLIGTWTNTNHATRDLVKIVFAAKGTGLTVDAFGACSPTPCNWGAVPAMTYTATVNGGAVVAFSAHYTFSFSQVIVVGHIQGKYLNVETFTHFTDGSGRADYYSADQMVK